MLIKVIILAIVATLTLSGCSHKDEKQSKKVPHKVHNKFHYKNMQKDE